MKKSLKALLCLVLSILLALPLLPSSFAAQPATLADGGFTDADFLVTKGRKIVNQKGEVVRLKGVNLGAWLIQEDWLCPYEEVSDHYEMLETLIERFGVQKAYELMNTYEDNFITAYDLDQIAAMGFNCVRVPFWYRNFYYDDNGTKILNENGDWDFSRLDWVVGECAARRLYVVLDMHGAPGFQSDAAHSGKADSNGLFDKTPQGERYRELTDELWTAIAARFKGNPAVAMYDLLNEPCCDMPVTEIQRRIYNESIYVRLYNTVRTADPDHIITLECIWTPLALPQVKTHSWTNVVYQVHFYNNSDFIFAVFLLITRLYHSGIPLMMGEFYPLGRTTWSGCFKTMNNLGFSWLLWTYKGAGHLMWESDWCLKGSKDGFERAKIKTDTAEEIERKWGEGLRTENGYTDTGHYENNVEAYIN